MTGRTVQLIVRHRPGRRAARRLAALRGALAAAGAEVIVAESGAAPLAIDPRADTVCVVGGDGTLRHVVAAIHRHGRAVPVAAFPGGTVNLVARECGYPRDPGRFARRLLADTGGGVHHVAAVGDQPLLACASVGPDGYAVAALSPRLKAAIGRLAYLVAFAGILRRWPRPALRLRVDGRVVACEAVYVAKARYYAGGWSFAPLARAADPVLHVVALGSVSRTLFARFVVAVALGRPPARLPGATCFTCTALTIEGDGTVPLQGDGDIVAHLPATIALRPEPIAFR